MSAAWLKDLLPASFRDVPFKVESHEIAGGRRVVSHEYAGRDKPSTEDMGRKARKYTIEAFILGADYFGARDRLLAALEEAGPGKLVHPYHGTKTVNCSDFKLRENTKDGRMVVFSITFEESGEIEFPSASQDTSQLVSTASDSLNQAAKANFEDKFSVAGLPAFVLEDATEKVTAFSRLLDKAAGKYSASNEGIVDLAFATRSMVANSADLARTPSRLADEVENNIKLLRSIGESPRQVFNNLKGFFSFGADDPVITQQTTTRQTQGSNRDALNQLIQIIAISEAAGAASEIEFESTSDAILVRDQLTEQLDDQMDVADDDESFIALQDLRAQVVKAIPPPDQSLATVATVNNQRTLPSLVLAYDLYESQELETDLLNRNKVRHPGFVPGGKDLEVLQVE